MSDTQLPMVAGEDLDDRRVVEQADGSACPANPSNPLAIAYDRIEPPNDLRYEDYNVAQRRAVLLSRIERVGHPSALNQSYKDLSDEFDCSKSTIHRDMAVLAEWVAENLARDHVQVMDAVFHGAVESLVDDGEFVEAAEVGTAWFEWLADMGVVERVADKVDLDATVRQAGGDTDAYRVIADDEAEAVEVVESDATDAQDTTPQGDA